MRQWRERVDLLGRDLGQRSVVGLLRLDLVLERRDPQWFHAADGVHRVEPQQDVHAFYRVVLNADKVGMWTDGNYLLYE